MSRIPKLVKTPVGVIVWVTQMHERNLGFHFDDDPAMIVDIKTDKEVFTDEEVEELKSIIPDLFTYAAMIASPFDVLNMLQQPEEFYI